MHVHILGICGTFMGGIAVIAKNLGFEVTGSDANVYPPMSTMLEENGIKIYEGYGEEQLQPAPDLVIVGNAMKRSIPCVEYMLNNNIPFTSGPAWLEEFILKDKKVLAVAGTHGKTSTSAMVAWILECANLKPSFLIGGVPQNFGVSARIEKDSPYFVIEADEYDCAFFDKRSKFVHYKPYVQILNNLEFDHADIFENIDMIKKQFHHLVRIIPGKGEVIVPTDDKNIDDVIKMGCWSNLLSIGNQGGKLQYELLSNDGSSFKVLDENHNELGIVNWEAIGIHNVKNALMAIAAANYIGVSVTDAIKALATFALPKRRMELKGEVNGVAVYDDFAHHPTAIKTTIHGLREKVGNNKKIIAVFEPRSNTMKLGSNKEHLVESFIDAQSVYMYAPDGLKWKPEELAHTESFKIYHDFDKMFNDICVEAKADNNSVILVMSNGGFNGIANKLVTNLA